MKGEGEDTRETERRMGSFNMHKSLKQLLTCVWLVDSHEGDEIFECDACMCPVCKEIEGQFESFPESAAVKEMLVCDCLFYLPILLSTALTACAGKVCETYLSRSH